ncbi:uncharacterized protein [Haliotis asinina]|uniref:uncharacterized protein n=1 Tax=Haliotis asinina TaxID=109174 RepID=UPI0035327FF8
MDENNALLIANLAVWPVIVATVLTLILYCCLRLASRCCFRKSKRHYMVQLKDYGMVNRNQDSRLHNNDDESKDKAIRDKTDQGENDTNNHYSNVANIDQLLRITSYSSEDDSLTDDMIMEDQQTDNLENIQNATDLETTIDPMYPSSKTTDGSDGHRHDTRTDQPLRPTPAPRLKNSSSSEQQTKERTSASTEVLLAQMADRFENRDKDDVFPSILATRTKTLPPSVSNASQDTKASFWPPPLPSTLPNWTRRGRETPRNALHMEKAGAEELHGDIGEKLMEKALNAKRKPTPPKTVSVMPPAKCPKERECQTISLRKNSINRRPTSLPPSVPNLEGKNHFETTECGLSGAEGGDAVSGEEPTTTYDEICDEQLHDADINHYDAIEEHLYDCIDDMPRCRRSAHRPALVRQMNVFKAEGFDDKELVNPFYARRLDRSFTRKMDRQEDNPYASLIVEDKTDPGSALPLSEQKTAIPAQPVNPRGGHRDPKHQVDAMAFKAEPFRNSLDSGYLTAIETRPYKARVSGYRKEISKERSARADQPGDEPINLKPDDTPLNEPCTHYVNGCVDVDKSSTSPLLVASGKEIKIGDGHYEDLSSDPFVERTKSSKPSVPPKPKPDKRYS